jgi:hypothetical protein
VNLARETPHSIENQNTIKPWGRPCIRPQARGSQKLRHIPIVFLHLPVFENDIWGKFSEFPELSFSNSSLMGQVMAKSSMDTGTAAVET